MPSAAITSKGQVTIPKAIRDALGVGPGDRLLFWIRADGTVELQAQNVDLRTLAGSVRTSVRGVTVEQMDPARAHELEAPPARSAA